MDFLFYFEKSKFKDLNRVLTSDPYADNSFARVGYTLKDGGSINEKEGSYVYFKTDGEIGIKLSKKLLEINGIEVGGVEKEGILKKINEQEQNAIEGFGSIFT
ncbi:MAG: hypothetical protein M1594_00455 [Candidatus Marsarchaeota archaeon]|nr:hypothetical protein [Candidatus Marsarchaeota archaeon]